MINLIDNISEIIKNNKKNKIYTIGIDGPTAAGKTILAGNIEKKLKGVKCFTIKMDWTLKSRNSREKSLKIYNENNSEFLYEAEDHMNLKIVSEVLKKIKNFNSNSKTKNLKIELKNLYNREGTAKNDLSIKKNLDSNYVIIVEGHYTGHRLIYEYLDYNVLLLCDKNELIKRKIERVKNYRSPKITKKYFELIDVPSFINFISRYGNNYSLIVDNSNYKKPKVKDFEYIKFWSDNTAKIEGYKKKNVSYLDIFSEIKITEILKNQGFDKKNFYEIFSFIEKLDNFTIQNFSLAIKDIKIGTYKFIQSNLKKLNKRLKKIKIEFVYTNNFHNLYYKKFPIVSGFNILKKSDNNHLVSFVTHINQKNINFILYWEGGVEKISKNRNLNKIKNTSSNYEYKKLNILNFDFKNLNHAKTLIPTDFTSLNFFNNKIDNEYILTDREESNINSFQILNKFFDTNIFWIQRFAKFSERDFFSKILIKMGVNTFCINNYIFALKTNDYLSKKRFFSFFKNWKIEKKLETQRLNDNKSYDKIIDNQRDYLEKEVNNKTKNFKVLDGKVFYLPKENNFKNRKFIEKELKFLLGHPQRIVRKATINFLINNNLNLNLESKKLWPKISHLENKKISLSNFVKISPSILSDLYFWLNLKRQKSSILATNIYDIRNKSLDISAYMRAAMEENTPIVLQSSFNSMGQKEKIKNTYTTGYLRLKNGPKNFVENIMSEATNLYLQTGKDFLFGIGVDHLDFRYNKPKDRIYRFLKNCQKTNHFTHYTLDSSYLLENKKIKNFKKNKNKIVKKIIKNEIDLLKKIKDNHIFDFEYCANELNYIENEKKVFLPNQKDINFFVEEFNDQIIKNNLNYINSRPKLIIGNLGTVHHGVDKDNYVKTEVSEKWIDYTQKYNFVSAVLHGTSRSHPEVLKRATAGCMKINVAGDFLQILVSNLPKKLRDIVIDKNDNDKKKLYLIRNDLNNIKVNEKKKIISSLYYKCKDLIRLINSPNLSDNDKEYFKYKLYNFDKSQIKYISNLATKNLLDINLIKNPTSKIKKKFLMSPIELDYGAYFKKIVKLFNKYNLYDFHLDVGDGQFISRVLDVTDKLKYIKKLNKKNKIHLHLMVKNPYSSLMNNLSYIEHYANLGADFIGLHRRSFTHLFDFENAIKKIIFLKKEPSIFLEIDETFDDHVISIIKKYNIKLVTFMGVPLGYGGQFFKLNVIPNIQSALDYIKNKKLKIKIEIDGGINFEILEQLKKLDIHYFAGWSVIKSDKQKVVERKLNLVRNILK